MKKIQFIFFITMSLIISKWAVAESRFGDLTELRDERMRESRDAFVIVNLIYSLLARYIGIEHALHKDLDRLYVKIKAIHKETENDTT